MNNLKRLFSLALAGAMLAGMMVMGASASNFTDADEIVNTEAVDIAVALSIINGKEDGSYFDPTGLVTRAEMAKMIAVAVNGGKEPSYGVKTTPTYSDIDEHWAEKWIEYCTDMKYINGRGDGTFDPNGNVTGIEAAKMILTALGYDATAYQLTGSSWAINTNFIASRTCDLSLYDNLDSVVMNEPITRDSAAQMIWNGLQNYVVEYNPDVGIVGGDLTYGYRKSGTKTLLRQAYDGQIYVGEFVGNYDFNSASGTKEGQIVVNGRIDGTNVSKAKANVPSDLDIDFIGEEVRVIFKDGKGSTATNQPDDMDTIYGIFVTGNTNVVRGVLGDFGDNKVKDEAKVKFDGTKYDVAPSVTVWTNYATSNTYSGGGSSAGGNHIYRSDDDANSDLTALLKKTSGAAVKMTFNANNEIDTIYVTQAKIARVTALNSSKVTLNNAVGALKFEDNDIYDGIAKDDVVEVTTLYAASPTASDAFNIVRKAESVIGTVEVYKENDATSSKSVTLDGTTYDVAVQNYTGSSRVMPTDVDSDDAVSMFDRSSLTEEFELFLIGGKVVGAVQLSEDNSNYSLVISASLGSKPVDVAIDGAQVEVMGSDGSKQVMALNSDSYDYENDTAILNSSQYGVGDIVTYSVDKSGYVELERRGVYNATADTVAYLSNTKVLAVNSTYYKLADDCVVYMDIDETSATDYKAYDIRDLKSFSYYTGYTIATEDGKGQGDVCAVYIANNGGGRPAGAVGSTIYGIVSKHNGFTKIDGTEYQYATVKSGDDSYPVYVKTATSATQVVNEKDIVRLDVTADDIYGNTDIVVINTYSWISTASNKAVAGYISKYSEKDSTITVSKNYKLADDAITYKVKDDAASILGTYAITKDTELYFVDRDDKAASADGSIDTMSAITHMMNVIVIVDPDATKGDEASVVIIETSAEADIVKDIANFTGYGYQP